MSIAAGRPRVAQAPPLETPDSLADEIARRAAPGAGLVLAGSVLGSSLVVLLGLATLAGEGIRAIWTRNGLSSVTYERRLDRRRASVGEQIELRVSIWNRKALPLAWLTAEDQATDGVAIRDVELVDSGTGRRLLRNSWSLAPYERVVRRLTIEAERRGVYDIGPATLRVGDLFGRGADDATVSGIDRYIVWPRVLPVREVTEPPRWGGIDRARRGLLENPALFAGVREYQPGDALRAVHHRASARLGRPVTKRFDPAREREVLVALDLEPPRGLTAAAREEALETLCVVAASVCRRLRDGGAAIGLAAPAWVGTRPLVYLPPAASAGQLERVFDVLARLPSSAALPFAALLSSTVRVLRPGATVMAITARSPTPFVPAARRMTRSGYGTVVLTTGRDARSDAAAARSAGIAASAALLDGSWREATALDVVP